MKARRFLAPMEILQDSPDAEKEINGTQTKIKE